MFVILVILICLVLAVVFYSGTLWLQSTIYSEATSGLTWRAPTAALVLTCFFVLFHFIARDSTHLDTLFSFSPVKDEQFNEFRSVREGEKPKLYRYDSVSKNYKLFIADPREEGKYIKATNPEVPWAPSKDGIVKEIIVEEDDGGTKKEARFKADLTDSGKFKKDTNTGQSDARFVEEGGGRVMTASSIGWLRTFRWGSFLANLLLNFFHLGLWFVCLWLLLRFQWFHALFLAIAFWIPTMLFLLPMIRG